MSSFRGARPNLPRARKGIVPMATVLVVDDDWDIRELLADIITDAGLKVIQASDGTAALKSAQDDLPDLILLDVWMPGFDGFQVLEKLRVNQSTRNIPVVLLTAMPPFLGEKEGLESGATHYIHKPWEAGVVEATLRVVLREAAARNGGEEKVWDLPVDSQNVEVKTPEVSIFQEPRALAGLRSGRRRRRGADGQDDKIHTADRLTILEKKMAGGLPVGSLNLAVGSTGAGKSVLCEHLAYGALVGGFEVAYFTSEHTPESLMTQMASIGLDVAIFLADGSLQIFPVPDPVEGEDSAPLLIQLSMALEQLARDSQFIVVDSITDLAGSCPEQNVIAFFSSGRRLLNQGKTMMMSIHTYAFGSEMFSRLHTLCDGYFTLTSGQVMGRPMRTLEINKVNASELITDNLVSFVVEPEIGMKAIPLSRSKA